MDGFAFQEPSMYLVKAWVMGGGGMHAEMDQIQMWGRHGGGGGVDRIELYLQRTSFSVRQTEAISI